MDRPAIWEREERIPTPSEKLIQKSKEMPFVPLGKYNVSFVYVQAIKAIASVEVLA